MSTAVATQTGAPPATVKPALPAGAGIQAIVPASLADACRLAEIIVAAGIVPRDQNTVEKVTVAILHGLEIGLKPMQAVQSIAVINGRPTLWGDAMLALVLASGLMFDSREWMEGDGDALTAHFEARRFNRSEPINASFSVADARIAGLLDKSGPWKQYRRRMLELRARSFGLRDGFPDVLKGLIAAEEAQDYAPMGRGQEIARPPRMPATTRRSAMQAPEAVEYVDMQGSVLTAPKADIQRLLCEEIDAAEDIGALSDFSAANAALLREHPDATAVLNARLAKFERAKRKASIAEPPSPPVPVAPPLLVMLDLDGEPLVEYPTAGQWLDDLEAVSAEHPGRINVNWELLTKIATSTKLPPELRQRAEALRELAPAAEHATTSN